jgi:arsenate reductase
MTIKIYGIPNCDTMKKARKWLDANGIDYDFHDYRKSGVPEKQLRSWVRQAGWEALLNRRGTTWRKLDASVRDSIDEQSAIEVMLANPAIIKRPVLESGGTLLIGFNEDAYRSLGG